MATRFKNNFNPSEVVSIIDKTDEFIILDNGLKISDDEFIQNYTPVKSSDPAKLYNDIQSSKRMLEQKMTKTILNKNNPQNMYNQSEEIDPNSFFNSSSERILKEAKVLEGIDPNKIMENPSSQGTIVRVLNNDVNSIDPYYLEERKRQAREAYNRDAAANGQPQIPVAPRLSDGDLNRYKQIDENDPNSVNAFIEPNQPKITPTGPVDPETGLDSRKTEIRKRQMDATGEDPYAEDVAKWKANKVKRIPVNTHSNDPIPHLDQSVYNTNPSNITQNNQQFDIMSMLLGKLKKNYEVVISFSIKEKIPNPEFLKLATENIDGDVVEHYTEEFMKNFLSNIPDLRNNIYKQIYKEVHGIALDEKKKVKINKNDDSDDEIKVNDIKIEEQSEKIVEESKPEKKVTKKSTKTKVK